MSTAHAFVLSLLAVGVGCGENVLVGTWELRSLSDAGPDLVIDVDAGPNLQGKNAQAARKEAHKKEDHEKNH